HKLQGKDTLALSAKYVDEGQVNAITNLMLADNAVTSSKIADNTITRNDVSTTFKAPYADTADYAIVVNVPYVDSARIAVKAYDAHKLQGKDTLALSAKYVDEGQVNAITNPMLADNAVTSSKIADNTITRNDVSTTFKAPYADTADYAIVVNVPYVDSARIAVNAYALEGNNLSALDTRYVNTGETDAISNTMIQDNAVTSAKIADGTILGDDIAVPLNLEGSVNWPNGIVHIKNRTTGRGIVIDSVGFGGVHIGYAFADGFNVGYAGQSGLSIDTVGGSAIRVIVTPFDAIGVDEAGFAALYAMHAGTGVQIDSSESDGIYAYGNFSGGRLIASNPQGIGLIAHAYNNTSTDTAIQAYGSGYATGGWYTGGLLDNKSAPCLISSELGIVTSGTATLSDGEAVINFDPLFADNIRTDIPIRITVTPKGRPAGFLYVAESRANGFRVALEAIPGLEKNGTDITFDWIAVGTLKDYQTSPDAQTQWQQMIKERDAQREARKQANRK
ncbi:MAG: hypothetical protein KGZ86_00770, partial [Candidatus Latescibacteria bacterium]|nr:hypothetical protein [Candidatus Latescibacterota bacterium]